MNKIIYIISNEAEKEGCRERSIHTKRIPYKKQRKKFQRQFIKNIIGEPCRNNPVGYLRNPRPDLNIGKLTNPIGKWGFSKPNLNLGKMSNPVKGW